MKLKSIRQLPLSTTVVLLVACGGSAEPVSSPPLVLRTVVEEIAAEPAATTKRRSPLTPTKTPSAPTRTFTFSPTFTLTHPPIPPTKLVDLSDVSIICEWNEQSKVVLCSISPDIDANQRKWFSNASAQRYDGRDFPLTIERQMEVLYRD